MRHHITIEGPKLCKAVKGACPYASSPHYSTLEEAQEAFAETMAQAGFSSTGGESSKSIYGKVKTQLLNADEFSLALADEVGAILEDEIYRESGVTVKDSYSKEELERLGAAATTVLNKLAPASPYSNKIHGPFAKQLAEAIQVLPNAGIKTVVNPIYTKTIRMTSQEHDGYHIAQAEIVEPVELEAMSEMRAPATAQTGEYFVPAITASRFEIEAGDYTGFEVKQVEKPIGQKLQAGDKALPAFQLVYGSEKLMLDLLDKGVLDNELRLVAGREEDFEKEAPEIAKLYTETARVGSFFAGAKPTGKAANGFKYVKVADQVTLHDASQGDYVYSKPLYRLEEKTLSYNGHTIGSKKYSPGAEANSILAHEFTHAVQSTFRGGIPGEKEIFLKLASGSERVKKDGYDCYDSFPDAYMGHIGGREVFTRATEGLFYPQTIEGDYLYSGKRNAEEVKRWALGAWAYMSVKNTSN